MEKTCIDSYISIIETTLHDEEAKTQQIQEKADNYYKMNQSKKKMISRLNAEKQKLEKEIDELNKPIKEWTIKKKEAQKNIRGCRYQAR
jgi:peptidoglycan hydrolase CwlO-like protein